MSVRHIFLTVVEASSTRVRSGKGRLVPSHVHHRSPGVLAISPSRVRLRAAVDDLLGMSGNVTVEWTQSDAHGVLSCKAFVTADMGTKATHLACDVVVKAHRRQERRAWRTSACDAALGVRNDVVAHPAFWTAHVGTAGGNGPHGISCRICSRFSFWRCTRTRCDATHSCFTWNFSHCVLKWRWCGVISVGSEEMYSTT